MNRNVSCRLLCRGEKYIEKSYTASQIKRFEKFIKDEYRIHWIMDNLPAATRVEYDDTVKYIRGYPVGFVDPTIGTHIFNHVTIVGKIHPGSREGTHRIVGFEVRARSVDVSRYQGNPEDPSDLSCTVKPVTDERGGLVLDSSSSQSNQCMLLNACFLLVVCVGLCAVCVGCTSWFLLTSENAFPLSLPLSLPLSPFLSLPFLSPFPALQ